LLSSAIALTLAACTDRSPTPPSSSALTPTEARRSEADEEQLDVPLAGLTLAQLDRFNRGRDVFTRIFTDRTGLGPSFNSTSCAGCHEEPSVGGVGDDLEEDIETHVSVVSGQACDDLAPHGGAVIQQHTTALFQSSYPGYTSEAIPPQAGLSVARRSTPMLFGFGFLDAVAENTIIALADPTDANQDGVSGRPSIVGGAVGRFGRKATDANLFGFNAGAFLMEIGVTSNGASAEQSLASAAYPFGVTIDPMAGPEVSDEDLALANDFVRFLRPPPQEKGPPEANDGRELFTSTGCATCHVPSLRTGPSPVAALSNTRVEAFTDLLLHDMGPGLADICRGNASPAEFRTEPLMGLRFRTRYLHDARSSTLTDAIMQHGGEATNAVSRFSGLSRQQQNALIAYLNTL
jgi:CxxC motif-containing protein (DUF1111 family)